MGGAFDKNNLNVTDAHNMSMAVSYLKELDEKKEVENQRNKEKINYAEGVTLCMINEDGIVVDVENQYDFFKKEKDEKEKEKIEKNKKKKVIGNNQLFGFDQKKKMEEGKTQG